MRRLYAIYGNYSAVGRELKRSGTTIAKHIKLDSRKGGLLISKDSNVGEIAILDKDCPNTMICGGIYRLPVKDNKYYLLAFIRSIFSYTLVNIC